MLPAQQWSPITHCVCRLKRLSSQHIPGDIVLWLDISDRLQTWAGSQYQAQACSPKKLEKHDELAHSSSWLDKGKFGQGGWSSFLAGLDRRQGSLKQGTAAHLPGLHLRATGSCRASHLCPIPSLIGQERPSSRQRRHVKAGGALTKDPAIHLGSHIQTPMLRFPGPADLQLRHRHINNSNPALQLPLTAAF